MRLRGDGIDEEHHIDWIEAQRHKIAEVGYQPYLAQQILRVTPPDEVPSSVLDDLEVGRFP